jgi:EpsI family protein
MMDSRTVWRVLVLSACLLGTSALGTAVTRPERTPLREPLDRMPVTVGVWSGHPLPAFSPDVLAQVGVDDYLNRVYVAEDRPLSLYIGYYRSQHEGDAIHSPQNCLPGAGWLPVTTSLISVPVEGRSSSVTLNRLLIQKGLDRQVVLYWYQSHGRVVASEYWSKAYLIYDAVRLNRSDAAIVRVVSPVLPGDASEAEAEARAVDFVRSAFPQFDRLLPI